MKVARYQVPGVGFNTPPVPDGSLFLNASPVRRGGYWASFIEFRRDKNGMDFVLPHLYPSVGNLLCAARSAALKSADAFSTSPTS
jgi:hypothetical protein